MDKTLQQTSHLLKRQEINSFSKDYDPSTPEAGKALPQRETHTEKSGILVLSADYDALDSGAGKQKLPLH